jgi:excisionase family DNA binding protein
MRRSRSGQRDKVLRARAIVDEALGGAARRDAPQATRFVPPTNQPEQVQARSEAIAVLTMQEAATRLGIGRGEVEAMVKRGTVKALMAGWTVVVPTSEVERLRRPEPPTGPLG